MPLALLVVLGLVAAACGGSDSTSTSSDQTSAPAGTTPAGGGGGSGPAPKPLSKPTDITIVMASKIETFAPALMADHFGEFKKENLNVTIKTVPSNEGTVMVAQNQAQLKMAGMTASFFNSVDGGVDNVWLANIHQNSMESKEGVWMRKEFYDSSGNIIPDKLKGAKIAAGTGGIGSPSAYAINAFLQANGASLGDIQSPAIGGSDIVVAIESGGLDGGYVLTPQWLSMKPEVAKYAGMFGGFDGAGFSASAYEMNQTFIKNQPEVAEAIMRAIVRTIRTYLQGNYHNDPKVLAALAEVTGSPADALAKAPSVVFNPNLALNGQMMQDIQEMWIQYSPDTLSYKTPIPLDKLTDRQLVEKVLNS